MTELTKPNSMQSQKPILSWGIVREYLELIRFSHTIFALPSQLWQSYGPWWSLFLKGLPSPITVGDGWVFCCVWSPHEALLWRGIVGRMRRSTAGTFGRLDDTSQLVSLPADLYCSLPSYVPLDSF